MGVLTDEMRSLVDRQRLGYVATVTPDGKPNLSPKGTTAVWDEDRLVFADIASPRTIKNLQRNAALEVNVVDPLTRKGFRFKGTGEVVKEGRLFDDVVAFYRARGVRGTIRHVVLVHVTQAVPLISPAYDSGATEAQVRTSWEEYWRSVGTNGPVPPTGE